MANERLRQEAASALATLKNSLKTRQDHPSYGYTKRRIQDEWSYCQGMLAAWLIATGKWDGAGAVMFTREAIDAVEAEFGFGFSDVSVQVLNC